MERAALRAEPGSANAAERYVLSLRELGCYESSNREAFAALARNPAHWALYGLAGQNFVSLANNRAGYDALNLYLSQPGADFLPDWHERALALAQTMDELPPRRRKARHDGLITLATGLIRQGDFDGARRALQRAGKKPYQGPSHQREMAWALYHLRRGDGERCAQHVLRAIQIRPLHSQVHAGAVGMFQAMGQTALAQMELLNAVHLARTPADTLSALIACDRMNAPHVARGMLRRMLRHQPQRFALLYNLCVCELKLGRVKEAARHIHLAREIDPDDVSGEGLFLRVMEQQEQSMQEVRTAAKNLSWYGMCTADELSDAVAPIVEKLAEGEEAFARALCEDRRIRLHLIHLLGMPLDWTAGLLCSAAAYLPNDECEALMREVLLQHATPSTAPVKRTAVAVLEHIGAEAPYLSLESGRLLRLDPARAQEPAPAFRERILAQRVRRAWQMSGGDRYFVLWAMEQLHRMTRAQKSRVIEDPARVWPMALLVRYCHIRGMEPPHLDPNRVGRGRLWALNEALAVLRSVK